MQLISYLDALKPRKRNRKIDVPVAIVFTKTDLCDEPIRDAEKFARANTSALYGQCRTRLEASGSTARGWLVRPAGWSTATGRRCSFPCEVEPRGIVEPFAWMANQLR